MLISVQRYQRMANGDLIATVLDDRGGSEDLRLCGDDAAEVERIWNLNLFDLRRYEQLGSAFPAPTSTPVEISGSGKR